MTNPFHPSENDFLLIPWQRIVDAHRDNPAIIEAGTGRTWTFGEIDSRSRRLAQTLLRLEPHLAGLPVVFKQPNGAEWIARFLTLLRVGAPAFPLDVTTPPEAVREIATRCGAAEWTAEGELIVSTPSIRYRRPAIALLKLTSGTTGEPKPIPFRACEIAADGRQVLQGMGIREEDRNFAIVPFSHSYGLGNLVAPLLLKGISVSCGTGSLPRVLASEFTDTRATVLPAVPTLFEALVRAGIKLPNLRLAISAGALLQPGLARAFLDAFKQPLHNFFGASETGGISYDASGEAGLTGRSAGRPLPGVTVSLTRRGRIAVAGPAVFTRGNRRRVDGFGEALTGDFGAWNELGELVLRGRSGAMIKVGARRLDPAEVERALASISGVRAVWVTRWATGGDERPAAVVATDADGRTLLNRLRSRLAIWKLPRPLVVVASLPLTARGKPDRAALLECLRKADRIRKSER